MDVKKLPELGQAPSESTEFIFFILFKIFLKWQPCHFPEWPYALLC